jgi:hypothetical protein
MSSQEMQLASVISTIALHVNGCHGHKEARGSLHMFDYKSFQVSQINIVPLTSRDMQVSYASNIYTWKLIVKF